MTIKGEYKGILLILKTKFGKLVRQKNKNIAEILLLITFGHHLGQDTISAICERLQIPRHQIYNQLKQMNVQEWRKLFNNLFNEHATEELKKIFSKSESSQSRAKIALSIDDSVLRRWGGTLGYIGKWWSGQFKHIVLGQDIILVTLKINDSVIPVRMWIMSKKGRYTKGHDRVGLLMEGLAKDWSCKGLDVSKIAVTADAGYADHKLINRMKNAGFKKILTGAKKNYKIRSHRSTTKATWQVGEVLNKEKLEQAPDTA